jgi:chemotaxis protein CheC
MKDVLKLTDMEFDALRELGNIGSGHIATSLSKLLNKDVDINIPDTRFVDLEEFSQYLGGPEKIISAMYLQITGDLRGEAMFIFPEKGALQLIDLMLEVPAGTTKALDEDTLGKSAFSELSNILTGTFLNSMSKMLDVKILPSVPHIATDMTQSIIDMLIVRVGAYADSILSVGTKINVMGYDIDGHFMMLFDSESLLKMLDRLHDNDG